VTVRLLETASRWLVHRILDGIREGALVLKDAGGERRFGDPGEEDPPVVRILDASFYRRVLAGGEIALARTWEEGGWESNRLTDVLHLLLRNQPHLFRNAGFLLDRIRPWLRLRHRGRANTRRGSRDNVASHYDLGNDFFRSFLDPGMTYSCALFDEGTASLAEAQRRKLDRACRWLDLGPEHHLLEIGTGWGSLALHAAARYGCRVTTTTLSEPQHARATRRVRRRGLENRVDVLQKDYREITGTYDRLVSIEMIEAVGERYLSTFFGVCDRLLRPGGSFFLQAIVIRDALYEAYRDRVDFIQQSVFPGGHLPSVHRIRKAVYETTRLVPARVEEIGSHYVRTLKAWQERLRGSRDRIRRRGYGEPLLRRWEYYLSYCQAGFREGRIGNVQMLLTDRPAPAGRGNDG